MARLSQAEVLRRYQAGERDFRGADLRSLRFRNQTLAGADFSGADLRGTDFLEADLRGTTFVGARCGAPWLRELLLQGGLLVGLVAVILLLAFGLLIFWAGLFVYPDSFASHFGVAFPAIVSLLVVAGQAVFAWEGFSAKGLSSLTGSIAVAVAVAFAGASSDGFAVVTIGFFAGAFAVAYTFAAAYVGAVARAVTFAVAVAVAAAVYIAVSSTGAIPVATIVACAGVIAYFVLSGIAFYRSRKGAIGYASISAFSIALGALVGTRFSGADLRGCFFTRTQLARVNFAPSRRQDTLLERVCWKGALGLDLANTQGTLLTDPRSRSLLMSGSAPGADLQGLNLRGAYLPQADLRGADLQETNLSEAVLNEAHLEGANLKASQCLGTVLSGAHLTGATLEGWNIDHATQLTGVDCTYVYLLEPLDALGQRRDDHHRERLPHDPDKSFGPGDFEVYFKQVIEEVKLLIKNGVDAKAFQQAFQEVMRQHPEITPESLTGIRRIGNDVLVTLQPSAPVEKGAVEQTLFNKYTPLKLENARLQAQLEGERRVGGVERQRAEDHRHHAAQLVELTGRLMPPTNPASAPASVTIAPVINPVMGNHSGSTQAPAMTNTTIQAGDGNLINTGSFNTAGGMVNVGGLSNQARITIEALPDQRSAEGQPTLRELLQELKASVDADTQVPESTRAEALTEVTELAKAAQDIEKNSGPARRAINALRGLSAGISETNKAVEESSKLVGAIKRLLPLIAAFFVG